MLNLSRALAILLLIFLTFSVKAANPPDVAINEIAWMGTKESSNDEWLELYNKTSLPINIDGWILKAASGAPEINLLGMIPANGFYLLERTDDNSVPTIPADQIYSGALNNNGEKLELYDNTGNLIDFVDCSSGWSAGDNITKQTMERESPSPQISHPGIWKNSQNAGGTPKIKNSIATMSEVEPQSSLKNETKTADYPSGVIINEILPSPEGPDAEEEWIEIFNQNSFGVNLSNWKIIDTIGAVKNYTFPEEAEISPKGYLVLSRPMSKITLNNDGDGLKLTNPNGKMADSVEYKKAPLGQSFSLIESSWIWSDVITPGSLNKDSSEILEKESETELGAEKVGTDRTASELQLKGGLAAVSQPFGKIQNQKIPKSFSLYLIATSLAIFSGAAIFLLKRLIYRKF